MGGFLIVVGLLLVATAAVVYVVRNPQILGGLAASLKRTQQVIEETAKQEVSQGHVSRPKTDDVSVTNQFRDLMVGEFVEYDPDPNAMKRTEYQVTGRGTQQSLNRSGREFSLRGEEYSLYVLDDGRAILFQRQDGWFAFNEAIVLEGESAKEFDAAGEAFSALGQRPRSHSFVWRKMDLTILDVGYMRYKRIGGKSHLEDGTMVKYMLAERADGKVVYLENLKTGTDRVWIGNSLGDDLGPYVGRVLRATA